MNSPTVLLIVDENHADRQSVEQALTGMVNEIHTASSIPEAMEKAASLTHITAMVVGIPEVNGHAIFDFRDQMIQRFGSFTSAFCSREDMSAYYTRLIEGDKMFFKPVEIAILREWISSVAGPPPQPQPSAPPTDTTTQPTGIEAYDEDLPVGTQLGDYKLERIIQRDKDFALYEAEQTSINRKVAIKTLYRKHRRDPVWVQAFVNEASARAKVNHPNVSLVYECVQEKGVNFYTLELVDAPSLADLAAQRANLSDSILWGILEACTSALEYFRSHQMQHRIITPQTILLQNGDQPRIANPVKSIGTMLSPEQENQQMQYLSAALKPFIRKGMTDGTLYSIIDRMGQDRIDGIKTISGLRRALNADNSAKAPAGVPETRVAEIEAKEVNKKAIVVGTMIGLILVIGGIIASLVWKRAPEIRQFDSFSKIPAGPFPYQDGEMIDLPDFWMGQQEVTIAQYAEFLEDVADKPTKLGALEHPDQPESKKGHEPQKWTAMLDAAMKGGKFLNGPIDPNCPVTGVDWWDAYTYARWKNARLPTEQEWEKAARGAPGKIYPWGNDLDYTKFNSGIDQKDKGDQKAGSVDGYQYWAPVDVMIDDVSYGVTGLAGNVSEWTATWDSHPDNPAVMVPIKRGASFATSEGFESKARRAAEMAEERNYFTGFRIVSDIEPGTDPNYRPPPPQRISTGSGSRPASPKGSKGTPKGKASPKGAPPTPAPDDWDPADGPDPFKTIFATPVDD